MQDHGLVAHDHTARRIREIGRSEGLLENQAGPTLPIRREEQHRRQLRFSGLGTLKARFFERLFLGFPKLFKGEGGQRFSSVRVDNRD